MPHDVEYLLFEALVPRLRQLAEDLTAGIHGQVGRLRGR
jgi:hypothetical protein